MGYERKLTDEKAHRLATSLGNSDAKLVNWIRGTSKANHDDPSEVRIVNTDVDRDGLGIETDWYYADFDVQYDSDRQEYIAELDWIVEKVWEIQIYSSVWDDDNNNNNGDDNEGEGEGAEMLPMDEYVLEACYEVAGDLLDEYVDLFAIRGGGG